MHIFSFNQRALPMLQESIAFIKTRPYRTDRNWAGFLVKPTTIIADIMRTCGRLEEAIQAQRVARKPDPEPYGMLAQVCVEMGQFERAVDFGRRAERAIEALIERPQPAPGHVYGQRFCRTGERLRGHGPDGRVPYVPPACPGPNGSH